MANIQTIKNWFKTGLKPTQAQFWATWDSFWHKDEKIPIMAIEEIEDILNEKADAEALTNHLNDANPHRTPATPFKFIQKGFGNENLNENEVGDIFCGWSNDGTIRVTEGAYLGGALDDSENFNFLVATEVQSEPPAPVPTLRTRAISAPDEAPYNNGIGNITGICGISHNYTAYWMGLNDYPVDGDVLYEDEELTTLKPEGHYACLNYGYVNSEGVWQFVGTCS